MTPLTPVERVDGFFLKRDDLFRVADVCGGKARTAWRMAQGARGLVTAGSRHSPQVAIVASVAAEIGIPCHVHVPAGEETPMIRWAIIHKAVVHSERPGYNGVIIARARQNAKALEFTNIPFGMECEEAVCQTSAQVANIPHEAKRVVAPVGSGMSLAGILTGLQVLGLHIPVCGVVVGADPTRRLMRFAPLFWSSMAELLKSKYEYSASHPTKLGGLELDEIYEAKCEEYLCKGDLLWIVGRRPL